MKREIAVHFLFFLAFFVLISLFRNWLNISFWPLWAGGLIGTILPDVDHLIYIYFLRPHELTSQRVNYMLARREVLGVLHLLAQTRSERKRLILHTALFQVIFTLLAFLVVSSSGSLFGKGLVLAFLLHLVVDQLIDLVKIDNIDNWFGQICIILNKEKAVLYWVFNLVLILLFGFLL